jgi:hypothetical protein
LGGALSDRDRPPAQWAHDRALVVHPRRIGRGQWPAVLAAARPRFRRGPGHTFAELAGAIDDAFARWDRGHLHQFWLAYGSLVTTLEDAPADAVDETCLLLAGLAPGERFVYEFDLGDSWLHLCTVGAERIDPVEELGESPELPTPYWGWGAIPDQYGRRWADDNDGGPQPPLDPGTGDLPPLGPWQPRPHRTGRHG